MPRIVIAAILLLILAAAPAARAQPVPTLGLTFVEIGGASEPWTEERRAAVVADAQAVLAWLRARGLDAPQRVIVLPDLRRSHGGDLELYVLNNRGLPNLWLGPGGWVGTYIPPDKAYILSDTITPRRAVMAHEFVHLLTGLPDWGARCVGQVDILCQPAVAYKRGTLGCLTLAGLGRPCERHYLPAVQQ